MSVNAFTAPREYLPALHFRSLGERLAPEVCARRSGGRPLRGRCHLGSSIRRTQIASWRTYESGWESSGWNYTQIRRAGSSSADLLNRTGNVEEKRSPTRSIFSASKSQLTVEQILTRISDC